jgi:hypothetical protein
MNDNKPTDPVDEGEYAALERNSCEHGCWPTEICEDCQDNGFRFHAVAGSACSIACGWCGWCWRDHD